MSADKKSVMQFFDGLAARWDEENPLDPRVVGMILDCADLQPGQNVLDVACGTGLMIPEYLNRGAAAVLGVDVSGAMVAQARTKFDPDPRVQLVKADFLACRFDEPFDRVVIFNSLPHFTDHALLLRRVADAVKEGGRLTVAMSESEEAVAAKLRRLAPELSTSLPIADDLSMLLSPWFTVDVCLSDDEKYIVSGLRNGVPAIS